MSERPTLDEYLLSVAETAAQRATCDRKHVGCVLARDGRILSTGYNGSLRHAPHCDDPPEAGGGHMMEAGHCVRTVHAEANAVAHAARNGVATEGATAYASASPCWQCFKLLVNAGIRRIVYREFYRDERTLQVARDLGIELVHLPGLVASRTE